MFLKYLPNISYITFLETPSLLNLSPFQVIICSTEEISSTSDDFGELHHALTHLPMKHDVEKLIQCALDIYLAIEPDKLLKITENRKEVNQTVLNAPVSYASLPLVNQRLLVCGAVLVLTAGLAYHRFFYSTT